MLPDATLNFCDNLQEAELRVGRGIYCEWSSRSGESLGKCGLSVGRVEEEKHLMLQSKVFVETEAVGPGQSAVQAMAEDQRV